MSIIRTYHNTENPFVQINKQALRDPELSLEAVGLWARMLSRPDNWEIKITELCKSCGSGPTRIYRILNELIAAGYAFRHQPKVTTGGTPHFLPVKFYVFESKQNKEQIEKISSHIDFTDARMSDAKTGGTTDIDSTNTDPKEKKKKEKTQTPKSMPAAHAVAFCSYLLEKIKEVKPNFTGTVNSEWLKNAEKLLSMRSGAELRRVINWALSDTFWRDKVFTTKSLLKNLDKMECSMVKASPASNSPVTRMEKQKEFIDTVKKKHGRNSDIDFAPSYVEFKYGPTHRVTVAHSDNGFRDQILNNLRKMKLSIEGL